MMIAAESTTVTPFMWALVVSKRLPLGGIIVCAPG
jgi:hypothetical protein